VVTLILILLWIPLEFHRRSMAALFEARRPCEHKLLPCKGLSAAAALCGVNALTTSNHPPSPLRPAPRRRSGPPHAARQGYVFLAELRNRRPILLSGRGVELTTSQSAVRGPLAPPSRGRRAAATNASLARSDFAARMPPRLLKLAKPARPASHEAAAHPLH